jgi:hypothetical protein
MSVIRRPRHRHRTSRRQKSRGQAVVEFALILPVFLLMTLGVVDVARVFTSYISLTNGVSNAALYAGSGAFSNWCVSDILISKTAGCDPSNSARFNQSPGNVAYQIQTEATGLDLPTVVMSKPQCKLAASPFSTGDCTSTVPGWYSQVTVTADYNMTLLTPLVSTIMGSPIHLTSTTTAAILQ